MIPSAGDLLWVGYDWYETNHLLVNSRWHTFLDSRTQIEYIRSKNVRDVYHSCRLWSVVPTLFGL